MAPVDVLQGIGRLNDRYYQELRYHERLQKDLDRRKTVVFRFLTYLTKKQSSAKIEREKQLQYDLDVERRCCDVAHHIFTEVTKEMRCDCTEWVVFYNLGFSLSNMVLRHQLSEEKKRLRVHLDRYGLVLCDIEKGSDEGINFTVGLKATAL